MSRSMQDYLAISANEERNALGKRDLRRGELPEDAVLAGSGGFGRRTAQGQGRLRRRVGVCGWDGVGVVGGVGVAAWGGVVRGRGNGARRRRQDTAGCVV
jgi:hypothetical protein